MRTLLLFSTLLLTICLNAQDKASTLTFYGITHYDDDMWLCSWQPGDPVSVNKIFKHKDLASNGGAFYMDGNLLVNYYQIDPWGNVANPTQYVFNVKQQQLVETRKVWAETMCVTQAYDERTDGVYGYYMFPEYMEQYYYTYGRMNLFSGWVQEMGYLATEKAIIAMAFNAAGQGYGIDLNGVLQKIDKDKGKLTAIGSTGIVPAEAGQSACFDPTTGKFYWAASVEGGPNAIYEINLETGEAERVMIIPDGHDIAALFIPEPEPVAAAPSEPTAIKPIFEGPSLKGKIQFHTPATSIGGEPLTGTLKAYVFLDEDTVEVDAEPDKDYEVEMSVRAEEMYNIKVWTVQNGLKGQKAKVTQWIGPDYPTAPTNIQLREDNGMAVLTWEAPKTGRHNGYVNPDEVTYTVARNGGGFWKENVTECQISEPVPEGKTVSWSYSVRPCYMGLHGDTGGSPTVNFGSGFTIPMSQSFAGMFEACKVVDANNDGVTWVLDWKGRVHFDCVATGRKEVTGDDWILTPSISLQGDTYYRLCVYAEAQKFFRDEQLNIYLGNAQEVSAMTQLVGKQTIHRLQDGEETEYYEFSFKTPATSGKYYLGYHCASTTGASLFLDKMTLDVFTQWGEPMGVSDLKATAAADASLRVDLEFVTPSKTQAGGDMSSLQKVEIKRNGTTIHTFDNPAVGTRLTYQDQEARQGLNTYEVTPFGANGAAGLTETVEVEAGYDLPGDVENLQLRINGNTATVTWDAPKNGKNGRAYDDGKVHYTIYDLYADEIADMNVKERKATFTVDNTTDQHTLQYGVSTGNGTGENEDIIGSNKVIVGKPYELPWKETWERGFSWYLWLKQGTGEWSVSEITGPDELKGYIRHYNSSSEKEGEKKGAFVSGRIALKNAKAPVLSFWTRAYTHLNTDRLEVAVATDMTGEFKTVKTHVFPKFDDYESTVEWNQVTVPLTDFAGADFVHLRFQFVINSEDFNGYLDVVEVKDDEQTGISTLRQQKGADRLFDLQGRQLKSSPANGVYIKNGKKYIH